MFVTENDIRRIINKEMSPEQAERRARTLERSKGALKNTIPGIVMKPGVIISLEEYEALRARGELSPKSQQQEKPEKGND